ncbi:MAG TPA: peptide chain release factor 2 [Verrucomicrobiales bacterium]|nr:peptide chain release factor 2 [Verrucomicrobiales bacterium]
MATTSKDAVLELNSMSTEALKARLGELRRIFDVPALEARLQALDSVMSRPGFWDEREAAQKAIDEAGVVRGRLNPYLELSRRVEDLEVLLEIALEEGEAAGAEIVQKEFREVEAALEEFEMRQLLSGPLDSGNAFLTLHAGAGGTESCDWAEMLMRMYQRWGERQGYRVDIMDLQEGEGAGIRSATLHIQGPYAYGHLQCERGVHRLVRISPFDAQNRRHTSFASADVVPETNEEIEIEVNESDLRVDRYRSGGKGGQNVNKVETAVRLTHFPSGVVVACQNERSQQKNYSMALKLLKAKLFQIEEDRKRSEMERLYGEKGDIAWGSQIRSYVFQPYQMVKDHRTAVESGNIQDVMDGNLERFIEAQLKAQRQSPTG